jgi:integrase
MALVHAAESEQDAAIFLAAAFTGLRRGELVALRWRDVDFAGEAIRVVASYTDGVLTTPKSGKVRSVPMAPEVATALARLAARDYWTGDDDLVFVASSATTSTHPPSTGATSSHCAGPASATSACTIKPTCALGRPG